MYWSSPNSFTWMTVSMLSLTLAACASVPQTGRSQLRLISPEQEMQLGLTEFEKLKQSTPVSQDAEQQALLEKVGKHIAAVAPLPGAQWEFVLFDEPNVPNAFCLPGGKVGVYTGILPITRDEAGLATVIGHEVAHAVARHGAERVSEALVLESGGKTVDVVLASWLGYRWSMRLVTRIRARRIERRRTRLGVPEGH